MPIYEYRCEECGKVFERLRSASQKDDPATCPHCGARDTSRKVSTFSTAGCSGKSTYR